MSQEPERPIEKQLRAAAEKRQAEAGGPFELHPATRRLLQGEVKRRYPQTARRGWLAGWRSLVGPRLVWAGSVAAILILAALVLPGLRSGGKKDMQLARTERRSKPADEALKTWGGRESTEGNNRQAGERSLREDTLERSRLLVAQPAAAPAAPGPEPAPTAKAPVSATVAGLPAPAVTVAPGSAPVVALTTTTEPDTSPAASDPLPLVAATPAAPTVPATQSSAVDFTQAAGALFAGRKSETELLGYDAAVKKDSMAGAGAGGVKGAVPAESASSVNLGAYATAPSSASVAQSVLAPSEQYAARRYGLARAPAAAKESPAALQTSNVFMFKTEGTAAAASSLNLTAANQTQWFANVFDKAKTKAVTKSGSPVLTSFQVMQAGDKLQVVDKDGSVYRGALPAPAVVDRLQSIRPVYFKVAGTNRSLKQRVEFTGNFLPVANQALNQALPTAVPTAADRLLDQAQNQAAPWVNSSIVGKAKLANGQELQIRANPVVK